MAIVMDNVHQSGSGPGPQKVLSTPAFPKDPLLQFILHPGREHDKAQLPQCK